MAAQPPPVNLSTGITLQLVVKLVVEAAIGAKFCRYVLSAPFNRPNRLIGIPLVQCKYELCLTKGSVSAYDMFVDDALYVIFPPNVCAIFVQRKAVHL